MARLALTALVLASGLALRAGFAQESPLSDAWKGDKLDAKWHATLLGDAQAQENSIKVENGAIRIRGGGSDIWGSNDNGTFIWQPANGDFQVTLEMRGLKRTDASAKVGIMVRSSLDRSSVNTFLQAMPKGGALQSRIEFGVDSGPGSQGSCVVLRHCAKKEERFG